MSFALLRNPVRRAAVAGVRATPRVNAGFRASFRHNSTAAPTPKKSNTGLYLGIAALAVAGGGFYYLNAANEAGAAGAQAKANFVPTRDDYQKVCVRVVKNSYTSFHCDF